MIQLENYNADTNYNVLEDDDIVNTLTSTATNKALSANQGKLLNDNINSVINGAHYQATLQNNVKIYIKKHGSFCFAVILATNSFDNATGNLGSIESEYAPKYELNIPYIGWSGASIGGYGQYVLRSNGSLSFKTSETVMLERNAVFAYECNE